MKPECVLFDLDGTLVETNIDFPLMRRELLTLAATYGLEAEPLTELDLLAIVETAEDELLRSGREHQTRELRSRAIAILEEIELRHAASTKEIPFARELVNELRARKIPIGVVTRNCRKASLISLEMTAIAPDVLVAREDTTRHKPHPDPLRVALGILGAQPAGSVMVGDHLMDVQSGKAAGMRTIGFLRDERPPDFFDAVGPDLIVRHLREVLDAIVGRDR